MNSQCAFKAKCHQPEWMSLSSLVLDTGIENNVLTHILSLCSQKTMEMSSVPIARKATLPRDWNLEQWLCLNHLYHHLHHIQCWVCSDVQRVPE